MPENHAEYATRKVWFIAIISLVLGSGAIATWAAFALAPTVARLDKTKFKPLDGLITNYNSKPLLAYLDDQGKLSFCLMKNYRAMNELGVVYIQYDPDFSIDSIDAKEAFAKILPDLENQYMGRSITTKETTIEEIRRIKVFQLLRQWIRGEEPQKNSEPQPTIETEGTEPKPVKPIGMGFLFPSQSEVLLRQRKM